MENLAYGLMLLMVGLKEILDRKLPETNQKQKAIKLFEMDESFEVGEEDGGKAVGHDETEVDDMGYGDR